MIKARIPKHRYFSDPRLASLALLLIFGLPILITIWCSPWFLTQDGPLHLYTAHILTQLDRGDSSFTQYYAVRRGPLPYLGSYHLLRWSMLLVSPRNADRIMITLTSLGFVASILWLRWRVAGWNGTTVMVPLAMMLALTKLWLLGFYPFLTGACAFAVTLGLWWVWRDALTIAKATILACLLLAGYFLHIVSVLLTLVGLAVLTICTPTGNWRRRLLWTCLSATPVGLLLIRFAGLAHDAGGSTVLWSGPADVWSIPDWLRYLRGADFVSIVSTPNALAVLSPALWCLVGVSLLAAATPSRLGKTYRGWTMFSLIAIAGGLLGPGGAAGGSMLRERLLLVGVAACVPVLTFNGKSVLSRAGAACLFVAVVIQIGYVMDYARMSNRVGGQFMQAASHVGAHQRVAVVIADRTSRYEVNPVLNLSNQLGIEGNNLIWDNYGPAYYYWPVQFRDRGTARLWEEFNMMGEVFLSGHAQEIVTNNEERWRQVFAGINSATDIFIIWGKAKWMRPINAQWYESEPAFANGDVEVFKHKVGPVDSLSSDRVKR